MLQILKDIDEEIFIWINQSHTPFWDKVMVIASDKYFWIPFYAALLIFLFFNFKKKTFLLLVAIALAIGAADSFSSAFLKPFIARLRPCHDAALVGSINIVNGCGSRFGFVSSHAANSFALAIIIALVLPPKFNYLKLVLFFWAIVVSYSRIYLGVHYPGDVLGGALLGLLTGSLAWLLFQFLLQRLYRVNKTIIKKRKTD